MAPVPRDVRGLTTEERIAAQHAIVASLAPGSEQHQLATRVLLLLQDSLHLLTEIDALTAEAARMKDGGRD